MKKGHVFFISGVAGAGKSTVINAILKENIKNLEFVKSIKTRELRPREVDGVDYIKVSKYDFEKMIENGELLEYNFVHNQNYYGTRNVDIFENGIEKGKIILKEVDMLIYPKLLKKIEKDRGFFTFIFLDLPENEIKNRMAFRGDNIGDSNYKNRIESSKKERRLSYLCDYIVDATKSKEDIEKQVLDIIKKVFNNRLKNE